MIGKLDDFLRFHQTALSLRSERQQVLASNIANADTPNYKARDVDFASALQSALGRAPQAAAGHGLAMNSPEHLPGKESNSMSASPLLYRTVSQGSVDGNTVDMDAELNRFTDNAVRYEASLTMINAQIKNLLAAIQG